MAHQSIQALYSEAERQRLALDSTYDTNTDSYRSSLYTAIAAYQECRVLADRLALFSPNETLEDITTVDLAYLLIDYRIASLLSKIGSDRRNVLTEAQAAYDRFLSLLSHYEILSEGQKKLYQQYLDDAQAFSTIASSDPTTRRNTKIANFQVERDLKTKLEFLSRNPAYLHRDEDAVRQVHLTNLTLCTHHTFQALESIALEFSILAMAPRSSVVPTPQVLERDARERQGGPDDTYDDKLDIHSILSSKQGPLLSKEGKPLRPFTLLDNANSRQQLRKGVFGYGHNLPTMTIDEYLEEERARGGIIEDGGEASGRPPTPDEDNYDKADAATYKAREWDEFVEANPKGSGNTLNRG